MGGGDDFWLPGGDIYDLDEDPELRQRLYEKAERRSKKRKEKAKAQEQPGIEGAEEQNESRE
jgi:hypothetical protein